jgi:hypothetical protein
MEATVSSLSPSARSMSGRRSSMTWSRLRVADSTLSRMRMRRGPAASVASSTLRRVLPTTASLAWMVRFTASSASLRLSSALCMRSPASSVPKERCIWALTSRMLVAISLTVVRIASMEVGSCASRIWPPSGMSGSVTLPG